MVHSDIIDTGRSHGANIVGILVTALEDMLKHRGNSNKLSTKQHDVYIGDAETHLHQTRAELNMLVLAGAA